MSLQLQVLNSRSLCSMSPAGKHALGTNPFLLCDNELPIIRFHDSRRYGFLLAEPSNTSIKSSLIIILSGCLSLMGKGNKELHFVHTKQLANACSRRSDPEQMQNATSSINHAPRGDNVGGAISPGREGVSLGRPSVGKDPSS